MSEETKPDKNTYLIAFWSDYGCQGGLMRETGKYVTKSHMDTRLHTYAEKMCQRLRARSYSVLQLACPRAFNVNPKWTDES